MEVKYTEKPIESLKRDRNQPRTRFDDKDLTGMAKSITADGMINSIEIDEQDVIVTGERRWRAAKLAGLTKVPVKILTGLKSKDRFRRQLAENIHTNTLTDWEKAVALGKLVGIKEGEKIEEKHKAKIEKTAELLGKDKVYVREHLEILSLLPTLRDELAQNRLQRTIVRAVNMVPEKLKSLLQKKIVKEKIPRDGATFLAANINLYPELTSELMKNDYSGLQSADIRKKIEKMVPNPVEIMKSYEQKNKQIDELISDVFDWLKKNHPGEMPQVYKKMVQVNLSFLAAGMKKWSTGGVLPAPKFIELPPIKEDKKD